MLTRRSLPGLVLAAAALISLWSHAANGQYLPVAGEDANLWYVQSKQEKNTDRTMLQIFHRRASDPAGAVRQTMSQPLAGRLARSGYAAVGDRLWLVFDNGAVWAFDAGELADGARRFYTKTIEPQLPAPPPPAGQRDDNKTPPRIKGPDIRSLAASRTMLWALVRVEDQKTLDLIDALPTLPRKSDDSAVPASASGDAPKVKSITPTDVPAGDDAAPATPPADANDTTDTAPKPAPPTASEPAHHVVRAVRLLALDRFGWTRVALPTDWATASGASSDDAQLAAWLVVADSTDDFRDMVYPTLLTWSADGAGGELRIYDHHTGGAGEGADAAGWRRRNVSLPPAQSAATDGDSAAIEASSTPVPPVVLDGQIAFGRRISAGESVEVELTVLRPDGSTRLGTLTLDSPVDQWSLVSHDGTVALVGRDMQGVLHWSRINLQGEVTLKAGKLQPQMPPIMEWGASTVVLIVVLTIVSPIILMLWRRDPNRNKPELPKGVFIGDVPARAAAFAIDLAPGILMMIFVFGISPRELWNHYPGWLGGSPQWSDLVPGLAAIGLYVAHTGLMELFTGASIGKRLMHLRVTDLQGRDPDLWQVLVRCIFKAIELALPPLLILPLFSPTRQRLGDVVAKTVVVTGRAKDEAPDENDARDDDAQHDDDKKS